MELYNLYDLEGENGKELFREKLSKKELFDIYNSLSNREELENPESIPLEEVIRNIEMNEWKVEKCDNQTEETNYTVKIELEVTATKGNYSEALDYAVSDIIELHKNGTLEAHIEEQNEA